MQTICRSFRKHRITITETERHFDCDLAGASLTGWIIRVKLPGVTLESVLAEAENQIVDAIAHHYDPHPAAERFFKEGDSRPFAHQRHGRLKIPVGK